MIGDEVKQKVRNLTVQGLGEHGNEFAFYSKDNGEPICIF